MLMKLSIRIFEYTIKSVLSLIIGCKFGYAAVMILFDSFQIDAILINAVLYARTTFADDKFGLTN